MTTIRPSSLFGEMPVEPNDILIWGVGGAGTNIVSMIGTIKDREGMANSRNVFIDTSRSNLNSSINNDDVFIVTRDGEELDGSGGVRATNVEAIAAEMRNAIKQFTPAKYNVIVGSVAGGSGGVIMSLLAQEMLLGGHHCVFVLIGSSESEIRAINTERSLSSLEAVSFATKRPITVTYIDYKRGTIRKKVDDNVIATIGRLSVFLSGRFHGLDTKDVDNFFDYTKIPSMHNVSPQLCLLEIFDDTPGVDQYEIKALSIGSLYVNPDVQPHSKDSRYDCVGYGEFPKDIQGITSMHFILSADGVKAVYDKLHQRTEEFVEKVKDSVTRESIVTATAKPSRHNIIL